MQVCTIMSFDISLRMVFKNNFSGKSQVFVVYLQPYSTKLNKLNLGTWFRMVKRKDLSIDKFCRKLTIRKIEKIKIHKKIFFS